jgi:hypothetical protein
MGCTLCCCRKKVDAEHDPVFVPAKDRKCTDALFCLLFIAFWCGMIAIAVVAYTMVSDWCYRGCLFKSPALVGMRVGFSPAVDGLRVPF